MKLSKTAILVIRGLPSEKKKELADVLGISSKTLYRYLDNNDDNLTKAAGLNFLKGITGLSDTELLEDTDADAEVEAEVKTQI